MPVNSVTDRTDPNPTCVDDESLGMSVCSPNGAPAPPTNSSATKLASTLDSSTPDSSTPSSPAVQNLIAKFSSTPALDTTGCGVVQDCAGSDGRPVVEGQNSSGPDAEFSVTVRRFAPFGTFGGGFEGDAKSRGITGWLHDGFGGFSTSPSVTSRTSLTLSVDGSAITPEAHANASHHFLLGDGLANVSISNSSTPASSSDGNIDASSAGSNPLIPLIAPDIDTHLRVTYDSNGRSLTLAGSVSGDIFPNAEVFVSDRAGNREMLGTFQTPLQELQGPVSLAVVTPFFDPTFTRFHAEIPVDPSGNFAGSPVVTKE